MSSPPRRPAAAPRPLPRRRAALPTDRGWLAALGGVLCALLVTLPAAAQERPLALTGATIHPVDRAPIMDGVLVVHHGRIVALGRRDDVAIPADADRRDLRDHVIMPGLVCTHSHIGGIGGADASAPIQPEIRIFDSINVRDSGFRRAVAGGLTTLNIMPGSGHLLSGQTVYVKLRGGTVIDDLMIRDHDGWIMGGLKMANGTNPMRVDGRTVFPGTRGRAAALVRQHFIRAREYRERRARETGERAGPQPRDVGMDAMIEVLEGRRIVHHHTHRHDDIMTVLRLREEFGFRVVLHHVSDGWMVADRIAAAGIPCSAILIDSPGGKLEAVNLSLETGAILEKAGVLTAFHTDDWITDSRLFLRMAALAVRGGMSRDGALAALTLNGATMLDLDDRIGSLSPGKDADFIILNGDPLSVYTRVLETWVEGRRVFDRSDPKDRLYAVGGPGAGHDQVPYFCCFGLGFMGGDQ